jgi:hypothetical protein
VTDAVAWKLEREILERMSHRSDCDPPAHDEYVSLMRRLEAQRLNLQRQDALRLETLIERRTGVRR